MPRDKSFARPAERRETLQVATMDSMWHLKRKLLCVRLDSAGDVLMTTPALNALKEAVPGRHLTLLTSASGAHAARLVPAVDDIIEFDAPWMKPPRQDVAVDRALISRLATGGYDAAVIFTVYSQNPLPAAYLVYLAGIPCCLAHCRENAYHLLSDRVPDPEPQQHVRHEVRRQLDLVATTGAVPRAKRWRSRFQPLHGDVPPRRSRRCEFRATARSSWRTSARRRRRAAIRRSASRKPSISSPSSSARASC
jgi:ADP-heptose:LPS heptosyltransferase